VTVSKTSQAVAMTRAGFARRRTAAAEPWRAILPISGQVALLASAGWEVTATVDAADPEQAPSQGGRCWSRPLRLVSVLR
jgi:hypothetical protein